MSYVLLLLLPHDFALLGLATFISKISLLHSLVVSEPKLRTHYFPSLKRGGGGGGAAATFQKQNDSRHQLNGRV